MRSGEAKLRERVRDDAFSSLALVIETFASPARVYSDFARIACYLQGAGLSDGASVAIAAANGAAASFAFLGTVVGGFRATPLNLVAGVKTLGFILSHSKTELILCADDCLKMVEDALAAMPYASHVKPRIISMDIDDGPRWDGSGITPVKVTDLRQPTTESPAWTRTIHQQSCP